MTAKERDWGATTALAFDRRHLLGGAAVAAMTVAGLGAAHAQQGANPHAIHGKGLPKGSQPGDAPHAHGRHAALLGAVRNCLKKGDACIKHCIALLNKGDTSLIDCLKTTTAMMPICTALERYATMEAKHLRELTQLCVTVNEECEAECRKHADHHKTCLECAEACAACITECNKLLEKKALAPFKDRQFKFASHTGEPWSSVVLAGHPAAVYFGYTDCPSVCPTTLQDLTLALEQLGSAANDLNILFVSVDPERDSVEHLAKYLSSFDARIVGLTGDPVELAAMAHAFGAHYERVQGAAGHTVDHSTSIYLVDRNGLVVDEVGLGARLTELTGKLRRLGARKLA